LTYAVCSAKKGNAVTLLESNARVGKKLLLTGGGRCNLTNADVRSDFYNNPSFVQKVLDLCPQSSYLTFLQECGIYLSSADEEGRVYPITYSSASVCDCLRFSAIRNGVKIRCDATATKIEKTQKGFCVYVGAEKLFADKVVVAVGSASQARSTNLDKLIDKRFLTATAPSLAPMKVSNAPKGLSGVRTRCKMTLIKDNREVATQRGELQFRDFGLSGICTLNLSGYVARARVKGDKTPFDLAVDFLPEFSLEEVIKIINIRKKQGYSRTDLFVGLLPNKIAEWLQKQNVTNDDEKTAVLAKNMIFNNPEPVDYTLSQVTSGGVDVKYLDKGFNLPNGVTVLGEALDVDGLCGGYNLHFAVTSAIVAVNAIK